jgi:hypothetical protein
MMREAALTLEEVLVRAFLGRYKIHGPNIKQQLIDKGIMGVRDGEKPFMEHPYDFFAMTVGWW